MSMVADSFFSKAETKKIKLKSGKEVEMPFIKNGLMSDLRYCEIALQDRLDNPDKYSQFENVEKTIEKIKQTIAELKAKGVN